MAANITALLTTLISANHILHYHNVCDAYGHISVRNSSDPTNSTFIMSANRAPALVSGPDDFVTYYIANASAVEADAPRGYIERYIHSEMYKRYPDVNSVIHAHAPDVLPYAISGVPLKPVFHMPGFLGTDVPTWDIANVYNATDSQDLLVRTIPQGASLAEAFAAPTNQTAKTSTPDRRTVVMRKHGFTTWGPDIQTAVYRAYFTVQNAAAQTNSAVLRNAFGSMAGTGVDANLWGTGGMLMQNAFEPLTAQQALDAGTVIEAKCTAVGVVGC